MSTDEENNSCSQGPAVPLESIALKLLCVLKENVMSTQPATILAVSST